MTRIKVNRERFSFSVFHFLWNKRNTYIKKYFNCIALYSLLKTLTNFFLICIPIRFHINLRGNRTCAKTAL